MAKKRLSKYDDALRTLKNVRILVYIFIGYLIIVGIGNISNAIQSIDDMRLRYFTPEKIDDDTLENDGLKLSQEILEFVNERKINDPVHKRMDDWNEYTSTILRYSSETLALYNSKFLIKVTILRDEFYKRGIKNEKLDSSYEKPVNYFMLTDVAIALAEMANQLETFEQE